MKNLYPYLRSSTIGKCCILLMVNILSGWGGNSFAQNLESGNAEDLGFDTELASPAQFSVSDWYYGHSRLNALTFKVNAVAAALAVTIELGQKVTVIADFGAGEQYEYLGTITWIAEESEFTPKSIQTKDSRANLVYAVKVAVENDGRLKLGQYGEVRL